MAINFLSIITIIFSLISIDGISAVNVKVIVEAPQHPGSVKFQKVIGGIPYTTELLGKVNNFLWSTVLKQNTPADRKPVDSIIVVIRDYKGAMAITTGNQINVSAVYLANYNGPMDLKWEFTSLMYHEVTHVYQWNGEGKTPVNVVEGIADYTILKANYFPPGFKPPGSGDRWDKGYDYTARFFDYIDGFVPGFVGKLNNMMRKGYDLSYFKTLTGKPVEQLWKEYKAKYPGAPN